MNAHPAESDAGMCGAANQSIDNGAPCKYLAGHLDAGIAHTTANGFWWSGSDEPMPDADYAAGPLTKADLRHIAGWWEPDEDMKRPDEVVKDIIAREVAKAQAPVRDLFSDERHLEMASLHLYQIKALVLAALDTSVTSPGGSDV